MMNENQTVLRGDIYFANLGEGRGSVQGNSRPCIIIQNNVGNKFAPTVNVIPITSKVNKILPVHVLIQGCGLTSSSIALIEQITTINKNDLIRYIGRCDEDIIDKIEKAIRLQAGFNKPFDLGYVNKLLYLINEAAERYEKYHDEYFIEAKEVHEYELKKYCEIYNIEFKQIILKRIIKDVKFLRDGAVINA